MSGCAPTDRLLQSLKVHVPGVTDALLQIELFNVIDEYLRRTSAWRYYEDIELEEGISEYPFAIPSDAAVVRVLGVTHNGLPLRNASVSGGGITQSSLGQLLPEQTFADGDSRFAPDETDKDTAGLFSYTIYRPNYITTTTQPDIEATRYPLNVALALTIAKNCLECECGDWALEEWMWDTFFEDWYNGALSRLYGMPAKPWSSPTIAIIHAKKFRNGMAARKQEAVRGFGYGIPGWRYPQGGWV